MPLGVNAHLEGCNDTHSETGEHPDGKSSCVETRARQPHQLSQLLHKLEPAVDGGRCCETVAKVSISAARRNAQSAKFTLGH